MKFKSAKFGISVLFLSMLIMFTSCSSFGDDDLTDKREAVTLYISAETDSVNGFGVGAHECMLVKEKGQASWNPWEFGGIKGFTYEKGYSYELLVTKIIYANPPADGGSYTYELIREVSKETAK